MNPKPFRTPKGRMVYGGTGGIAPDIKLDKPDQKTNKAMSKLLQSHQNVFFRFAIQYIDSMPNKPNIIQQLVVTDKLFLDLKNYLLKMNTAQSVQILKYPDEVIKKALGTELAGYLAGDLGRYHFNLREDLDVISAVQYFQQAKRLLTLQVH
jgi:hypothetical protein